MQISSQNVSTLESFWWSKKTHFNAEWRLTKDAFNYFTSVEISELGQVAQSGDGDE